MEATEKRSQTQGFGRSGKARILPGLTLMGFVLMGMCAGIPTPKTAAMPEAPRSTKGEAHEKIRENVVGFLEGTLRPAFGGEVFAAYHLFGTEGNKLFVWSYVAEYYPKDERLELGSAASIPMMIALSEDRHVQGHWKPLEGADYADSIRKAFPPEFQDDVLEFQSQHPQLLAELKTRVRQKAREEVHREMTDLVLPVDGTVILRLDANKTTGYSWHERIEGEGVNVVSDRYEESRNEKGLLGSGGKRIYEIKGVKEGRASITFSYYRHWEPEDIRKSKRLNLEVVAKKQLKYMSIQDLKLRVLVDEEAFPPGFSMENGEISCRPTSAPSGTEPRLAQETLHGRKYCLQHTSEGAAGTIYQEYTYATVKDHCMLVIDFTIRSSRCGHFGRAERSECREERKKFDPNGMAAHLVENADPGRFHAISSSAAMTSLAAAQGDGPHASNRPRRCPACE